MPFEKGKSGNPKGRAGGHHDGRPPNWLREAARKALKEARGVEFMRDVAKGKEFPQLATSDGEVLPLPPSLKDRASAVDWLADRAEGKATQQIEHSGEIQGRTIFVHPNDSAGGSR